MGAGQNIPCQVFLPETIPENGMFCPGCKMASDVLSRMSEMAWDVLFGVTKTAWDILSGVANLCGMFCPGCQIMAWDALSRGVLSYILFYGITLKSNFWMITKNFEDILN